jgi:peptide deformylase
MIYPIVAYGDPVLRKEAQNIPVGEDVKPLIADMYETMYQASGVGLAAPQIGKSVRVFIIDSTQMEEDDEEGLKTAFINPEIIEEYGDDWTYEEGCLSIPRIRENVDRAEGVRIKYYDEEWVEHEKTFDGITARVILHEYDHIEGILFTDYLTGLKRRLIKRKLLDISKGRVNCDYRMKFPK